MKIIFTVKEQEAMKTTMADLAVMITDFTQEVDGIPTEDKVNFKEVLADLEINEENVELMNKMYGKMAHVEILECGSFMVDFNEDFVIDAQDLSMGLVKRLFKPVAMLLNTLFEFVTVDVSGFMDKWIG